MFELKPLSHDAVSAALEKAERYRLLNEPLEAESICLDVLEVEPENQAALVTLLLSLTDQFDQRLNEVFTWTRDLIPKLAEEYSRAYYSGIICERRAGAHLRRGGPGSGFMAYDWYRQAMESYDKAAELRPPGNDDAILRWNTCARILERHPDLVPEPESSFQPLLE